MDENEELALGLALGIVLLKKRRKQRVWTKSLNTESGRNKHGFYEKTFLKAKREDSEEFRKMTRMNVEHFDYLLSLLSNKLKKSSNRKAINPEQRLGLTIMYLAQGTTFQYLAWSWKLGYDTVRNIIYETCDAIWNELYPIYLSLPNENEWRNISVKFSNNNGMPNCVGAIDGKHINIKCPPNSGSQYFNYKNHHSIVLLGVCDADYCFTAEDIGAYGSQSDGGIFSKSKFGKKLLTGKLKLPPPCAIQNSNVDFPYYFVADAAFPLKENIMKPYAGRNLTTEQEHFNNKLSKARRIIENTFGILAVRWRVLTNIMNCYPENVTRVVQAAVVLHNFLKINDALYCPTEYVDREENGILVEGLWRQHNVRLQSYRPLSGNASRNVFELRDYLKNVVVGNMNQ